MNEKSIEIIRDTLKPDRELIEKTKAAAAKKRTVKPHIPALVAACLILVICVSSIIMNPQNGNFESTIPLSETTTEKDELFYSELIFHRGLSTINANGSSTLDIAAFSESHMKECVAIVEGEILNVREKEYTVLYEFDKFSDGGILTEKTTTLIFEIKVGKNWCGDINEGEHITVENETFLCGEIFVPAVGGKYVLPLCDSGEDIRIDTSGQKYLSGDTKRESKYSILYPFHPQIEKTDKGYLFTSDWKSLITKDTQTVTVDIPMNEELSYYADKMRLNSAEVFEKQFKVLLTESVLAD